MLNLSLLVYINIFITGMVFLYTILIGSGLIQARVRITYLVIWSMIFIFLGLYTLEFSGIIDSRITFYQIASVFIPFIAAAWLITAWRGKYSLLTLLLLPLPVLIMIADNYIALFAVWVDSIIWITVLITGFILFKRTPKKEGRRFLVTLLRAVIIGTAFVIPDLINIVISIIKQRPIHIVSLNPSFIGGAIVCIVILDFFYSKTGASSATTLDPKILQNMTLSEKLAASIIHEIKNPLAAIQSLTQQLHNRIETIPLETSRKYLTIMEEELTKVKDLSDSFLLAVKKDPNEIESLVDVYLAIKSVETLMQFELKKHEITCRIEKNLLGLKTCISEQQLRQILLNLFFNAIEAGAKLIQVDGKQVSDNIMITITNNGPPIKTKDRGAIFTPLYTTRESGTGLGLAISRTIAEIHGGKLELTESNSDKTTFKLSLLAGEVNEPSNC